MSGLPSPSRSSPLPGSSGVICPPPGSRSSRPGLIVTVPPGTSPWPGVPPPGGAVGTPGCGVAAGRMSRTSSVPNWLKRFSAFFLSARLT